MKGPKGAKGKTNNFGSSDNQMPAEDKIDEFC